MNIQAFPTIPTTNGDAKRGGRPVVDLLPTRPLPTTPVTPPAPAPSTPTGATTKTPRPKYVRPLDTLLTPLLGRRVAVFLQGDDEPINGTLSQIATYELELTHDDGVVDVLFKGAISLVRGSKS